MAKKSHRRHTTKKSNRSKAKQNKSLLKALSRAQTAELRTLKLWEITDLLKTLRSEYDKRVKEFDSTVSSPAIERMEKYYEESPRKNARTANRDSQLSELRRLRDFFSQKTSTQQGAERVWYEQDKLIFGTDERGEPRARLSKENRDEFWKIYNEFLNQNPSAAEIYYSRNIYSELGEMYREGDRIEFDTETIANLKARLESKYDSGVGDIGDERKGNVYSGRRRNKSR